MISDKIINSGERYLVWEKKVEEKCVFCLLSENCWADDHGKRN